MADPPVSFDLNTGEHGNEPAQDGAGQLHAAVCAAYMRVSRSSSPVPATTPIVKICGLSTPDTMAAALKAGADRVGLVFFPRSPRHVSLALGGELARQARAAAAIVALTVDADDAALDAIVRAVAPDWLQLHGCETPERVDAIRQRYGILVMKAIGVAEPSDLAAASAYRGVTDAILFDAKPPRGAVLPGGNGVAFDWTMLREATDPFMLSGGLSPENVAEALRVSGAGAVDVSSGVEHAPGRKDPDRIRRFVTLAKGRGSSADPPETARSARQEP